jgi:hypothetical protein
LKPRAKRRNNSDATIECAASHRSPAVPRSRQLSAQIAGLVQAELGLDATRAQDFAFHMTDWIDDLERLRKLYRSRFESAEAIVGTIFEFLAHVPAHLNAAHVILWNEPVPDPFGLGVVTAKVKTGPRGSKRRLAKTDSAQSMRTKSDNTSRDCSFGKGSSTKPGWKPRRKE